jgi:lipopolysaccharide/colanic/teichoic acid biosynthesis glycosyltransferase
LEAKKRLFDVLCSLIGILLMGIPMLILFVLASIDTKSNNFFFQTRVGQFGNFFTICKFKTVDPVSGKISSFGKFLRKSKLDELPQLLNVLVGDMSLVGPRPDIPGYYDKLEGQARKILELKPGITSLASIKYRNEEYLLSKQENPLRYNDEILFPDKVKMNLEYYYNRTFLLDLRIIIKTFI